MDSFFLFDRSMGMVMAVPTAVACFHSSPGFQVSLVLPGQWHNACVHACVLRQCTVVGFSFWFRSQVQ